MELAAGERWLQVRVTQVEQSPPVKETDARTWEEIVGRCHFHHTLLVKKVTQTDPCSKRRERPQHSREECQGHGRRKGMMGNIVGGIFGKFTWSQLFS